MKKTVFAACAVMVSASALAQSSSSMSLDTPAGGWRASSEQRRDFVQEVHYPASNVNTNGLNASALIKGRIAKAKKTEGAARDPARLVVDGVAIPLLVDAEGQFERPWSFGSGSHGVEVREPAPQGSVKAAKITKTTKTTKNAKVSVTAAGPAPGLKRVQFYEASARTGVRLRLVLSWDSDSTDLDLHVVSPDGQHVFYGSRVADNGGALDVDVTTGFGPEIYASPTPPPGIWHAYVNYYGAGEKRDVITVAQLAIITDEGTPREKQQVFRVPMRKPGELTRIRSFVVPGAESSKPRESAK